MPPLHSAPPPAYAIDARCARRNADRAAGGYAGAAHLEREVGLRMLERLDYVKLAPGLVLDAGSGPGLQAELLAQRYRGARVVALDCSLPMLRTIRPRAWQGRLLEQLRDRLPTRFRGSIAPLPVCSDMARMPIAARSCMLLWSNMALHLTSDLPAAIAEFHRVLEIDGLLMFSTPGPDTLKELRGAFNALTGPPHVHQFIDMHDLGDMLIEAGFAAPVMDTETITLTYAGTDELLADLRGSGQTCALAGRGRGLMGARGWHRVQEALEKRKQSGRLPTTVEVVYGHAWKAAPRRNAEGHAIVNLDPGRKKRN